MISVTPAAYAGIYLPTEAASYLRATFQQSQRPPTSRRIHSWITSRLIARHLARVSGRERVIDFADLISCQAIASFRAADISLQKIRKAEEYFRELYGIDKPFARRAFWYSRRDIFAKLGEVMVAGTRGGQLALVLLNDWVVPLRVGISFDGEDDLAEANEWKPASQVSLRPNVQFGQPCLAGTRIPTQSLWSYVTAGDPIKEVAAAYNLTVADVDQAIKWENRLRAAV